MRCLQNVLLLSLPAAAPYKFICISYRLTHLFLPKVILETKYGMTSTLNKCNMQQDDMNCFIRNTIFYTHPSFLLSSLDILLLHRSFESNSCTWHLLTLTFGCIYNHHFIPLPYFSCLHYSLLHHKTRKNPLLIYINITGRQSPRFWTRNKTTISITPSTLKCLRYKSWYPAFSSSVYSIHQHKPYPLSIYKNVLLVFPVVSVSLGHVLVS